MIRFLKYKSNNQNLFYFYLKKRNIHLKVNKLEMLYNKRLWNQKRVTDLGNY